MARTLGPRPHALTPQRVRAHARVLAVVAWAMVLVSVVFGTSVRTPFGPTRWPDFVQFYTLGTIARHAGPVAALSDSTAFQTVQRATLPGIDILFPAVYPPPIALVFAPFSLWPFAWAGLAWVMLTLVVYAAVVRRLGRHVQDRRLLLAAAAGFPPVWQLAVHAQISIIPFVAFALAGLAFERKRHFAAGLAIGLLGLKPQLGLVIGFVVLLTGQWRVIAGAISMAALQTLAAVVWFGPVVLGAYPRLLRTFSSGTDLITTHAANTHSIRTLTRLAPPSIDIFLWVAAAIAVLVVSLRVWRMDDRPVSERLGVIVIGTVLMSPHLFIYDAVILVLAALWLARAKDTSLLYWLTVSLAAPTAMVIGIQASVILMAIWFLRTATDWPASDIVPAVT